MCERLDPLMPHADAGDRTASDEQLLLRYRDRGDVLAFETLVHRYERPIYNYLRRYMRNGPLADEVCQATLLRLHAKCEDYDADRRVRPWLYSLATHLAVDALRTEGKHRAVRLDEPHGVDGAGVRNLLEMLSSADPRPTNWRRSMSGQHGPEKPWTPCPITSAAPCYWCSFKG